MVKGIAKTLGFGIVMVAAAGLLAMATYIKYFAFLLWPGFLLMNYVYSLLGFQGIGFSNYGWIFWPALVLNVILYALLYTVFRTARLWKQSRRQARLRI